MSDQIPSIQWEDFVRVVEAGKIAELKSCEVLLNGNHPFTAVIFHGDAFSNGFTRPKAEQAAVLSNMNGGKNPEELLRELEAVTPVDKSFESPQDKYPNLAKARAARQSKRQTKEAVVV